FVALETPLSFSIYKIWLENQFHGDMKFLERHQEAKAKAQKLLPKARSAIVIAQPYIPHPRKKSFGELPIALYAQGSDYHHWFQDQLKLLCNVLSKELPDEQFLPFA